MCPRVTLEQSAMEKEEFVQTWELIDSMDGRRWLGRVVDGALSDGQQRVTLCPAWEILDVPVAHVPVQRQLPLANGRRQPQTPSFESRWVFGHAREFASPLGLPGLFPWRVTSAGGTPVKDLPALLQDLLFFEVQKAIHLADSGLGVLEKKLKAAVEQEAQLASEQH